MNNSKYISNYLVRLSSSKMSLSKEISEFEKDLLSFYASGISDGDNDTKIYYNFIIKFNFLSIR